MSENQDGIRYTGQALVPWTQDEVIAAFLECHLASNPGMFQEAFIAGVKSREKPDVPKPFKTCWGQWFPTDVLGNPMREVSPGKWENSFQPSEYFIDKILKAFQNGIAESNKQYPVNPHLIDEAEWKAWERGVAYGNARNVSDSQSYLVQRITTAYEQGVGQGQRTDVVNPYKPDCPEYQAWNNGREVGKRVKDNQNAW